MFLPNFQLLKGTIRHRRFKPKIHEFCYTVMMFCFDISDISKTFKGVPYVSVERFNWFSFRRRHYLDNPEISLNDYARQLIKAKYKHYPTGKIYLLTNLSSLGYCFNPISLYLVFDEFTQRLDYLIIEVTNTPWGEKHNYVLQTENASRKNHYHFRFKKEFHVSPFMTMNYDYQFNLRLTSQSIIVHMENHKNGIKDFDATLRLNALNQTKPYRRHALITYKVAAAIYWQALKLGFKRVPVYTHPKNKRNYSNDLEK